MTTTESQIELDLIAKLGDLKYTYRHNIRDRAALEANSREKFAVCLPSFDDAITSQSQKLYALKPHMKSLMQQIFLVPDEVQG